MNFLDDALKLDFVEKNEFAIEIMIKNFMKTLSVDNKLYKILDSTLLDIAHNGINNYHYQVLELIEDYHSNVVLA